MPWILLLDVASVHTSADFRGALKDKYPWAILCFVPGTDTATCQPLDVSCMKSFKSELRWACSEHFVRTVCAATDANDEIDLDLTVITHRQKLLAFFSDASAQPRRAAEASPRVEALARS